MPKNIVLLSDGTGNTSATLFTTNVWRLYEALDLSDPDRQVAYYDDGVGTSSCKPLAILGGVFGFGLKRNVIDLYSFLCRNYRQGATPEECDRIFGFGFSRGSFTIRVVAGLVAHEGLARYDGNAAQLTRDAKDAYRAYRRRFKTTLRLETPLRWSRDQFIRLWRCLWRIRQYDAARPIDPHAIHFLGLWDTVNLSPSFCTLAESYDRPSSTKCARFGC